MPNTKRVPISIPPYMSFVGTNQRKYVCCTDKFIEHKCVPLHHIGREIGKLMTNEALPILERNTDNLNSTRLDALARNHVNLSGTKDLNAIILGPGVTAPDGCTMSPIRLHVAISQPHIVDPMFDMLYGILNMKRCCVKHIMSSCFMTLDGRCLWELLTEGCTRLYSSDSCMYRDALRSRRNVKYRCYFEYYSAECLAELLRAFTSGLVAEFPKYWEIMGDTITSVRTGKYSVPLNVIHISGERDIPCPNPDGSAASILRNMIVVGIA